MGVTRIAVFSLVAVELHPPKVRERLAECHLDLVAAKLVNTGSVCRLATSIQGFEHFKAGTLCNLMTLGRTGSARVLD